ncbi:uncharacterized protein [Henckelia pumila]|uniref:uncharacterized protein n=1 Tax=Henckelia pumila TaxID=405737 RepID=UPI003C6DF40E
MIILIPTGDSASRRVDFKPISLCNVANKIITKILALHMKQILTKIISPSQSGFVSRRHISDNILMAQEMVSQLNYRMGFPIECNVGLWLLRRGMRYDYEGDPLSHLLFVIADEYLSKGLDVLFDWHPHLKYHIGRCSGISHLAYANDIIIFSNGSVQSIKQLRRFLYHYEACSGQLISNAKSVIITSNSCFVVLKDGSLNASSFAFNLSCQVSNTGDS